MRSNATRLLLCLVEGDSAVFQVKVPIDDNVLDIKKLVLEEGKNSALRNVDAKDLVLWKLDQPECVDPDDTLALRVALRGADLSQFATRLSVMNKVSKLFPQDPSEEHLHIIIQTPSTEVVKPECLEGGTHNRQTGNVQTKRPVVDMLPRSASAKRKDREDDMNADGPREAKGKVVKTAEERELLIHKRAARARKRVEDKFQQAKEEQEHLDMDKARKGERAVEKTRRAEEIMMLQEDDDLSIFEIDRQLAVDDSEAELDIEELPSRLIQAQTRGAKRKEPEYGAHAESRLRRVTGKCDRCQDYKRQVPCEYGEDDAKCRKCTKDKKMCTWDGVTRKGVKRKVVKEKVSKKDPKKAVMERDASVELDTRLATPKVGKRMFMDASLPGARLASTSQMVHVHRPAPRPIRGVEDREGNGKAVDVDSWSREAMVQVELRNVSTRIDVLQEIAEELKHRLRR